MDRVPAAATTLVDMFATAKGCAEGCLHCGAYEGAEKADWTVVDLTKEQIRANIKGAMDAGFDFARFVTTDVNTEPLGGPNGTFVHLAEALDEFTKGKSRAICISHGMRVGRDGTPVKRMEERMDRVVQLMHKGVVPMFVLTVDSNRHQGKIDREVNINSYVATLQKLRPILEHPEENVKEVRVTVSIQGTDGNTGPLSRVESLKMFEEVRARLNWPLELQGKLHYDDTRAYVKSGRAALLPGLSEDGACDVVPDAEFVRVDNIDKADHFHRARVTMDGRVERQAFRPGYTYNTTVKGLWSEVWSPEGVHSDPLRGLVFVGDECEGPEVLVPRFRELILGPKVKGRLALGRGIAPAPLRPGSQLGLLALMNLRGGFGVGEGTAGHDSGGKVGRGPEPKKPKAGSFSD